MYSGPTLEAESPPIPDIVGIALRIADRASLDYSTMPKRSDAEFADKRGCKPMFPNSKHRMAAVARQADTEQFSERSSARNPENNGYSKFQERGTKKAKGFLLGQLRQLELLDRVGVTAE